MLEIKKKLVVAARWVTLMVTKGGPPPRYSEYNNEQRVWKKSGMESPLLDRMLSHNPTINRIDVACTTHTGCAG